MIKITICEDDQIYLQELKKFLTECCPDAEIIECVTPKERQQLYQPDSLSSDIILMDIELPEMSGIYIAKKILQIHPKSQIIYITQYAQYCSDVYETEHTYFIHKPTIHRYLPLAIQKAMENINNQKAKYLTISWNRKEHSILLDDIIYMERTLRTTNIHVQSSTEVYHTSERLPDLIKRLDSNFICCHRSYLVNLDKVIDFKNNCITLTGDNFAPVSQKYLPEVKQRFLKLFMAN